MTEKDEWLVIDDTEQELLIKEKFESFSPEIRRMIVESFGLTEEYLKKRNLQLN